MSVLCFKIENHEFIHHCFGFAGVFSPVFTDLDLRAKSPSFPDPILLTHPPLNGSSFSNWISNSSNLETLKKKRKKNNMLALWRRCGYPAVDMEWGKPCFLQPKTSHLRIWGYSQRSTCELFHLRKKLFHNPGFFGRCWDVPRWPRKLFVVQKDVFLF